MARSPQITATMPNVSHGFIPAVYAHQAYPAHGTGLPEQFPPAKIAWGALTFLPIAPTHPPEYSP